MINKRLRIAFQGERGAYSEMATILKFPESTAIPLKSFHDVFETVINDLNDLAVVPIENSIEGSVNETYDLLLQDQIYISGEIFQRINHCLIVNKDYKKIMNVYSHPQALGQCRNYIESKKLEPIPMYDTAGAVKFIKENKMIRSAAIASRRAAEIYEMEILEEGIEDKKNNFTRFFVLSKQPLTKPSGKDRTSIIFSLEHKPGSLYNILKEFSQQNLNLTKIESRPTKETPWEYYFYVDFDGHYNDEKVMLTLNRIKIQTKFFKLLGSYPKGIF
ncbi:MAG TPA: prephenate dehydratase [Nitrososphaeraceae archaeon]|nr:prephenate dehydratase [Nitrososphaeraceae archaeon]